MSSEYKKRISAINRYPNASTQVLTAIMRKETEIENMKGIIAVLKKQHGSFSSKDQEVLKDSENGYEKKLNSLERELKILVSQANK